MNPIKRYAIIFFVMLYGFFFFESALLAEPRITFPSSVTAWRELKSSNPAAYRKQIDVFRKNLARCFLELRQKHPQDLNRLAARHAARQRQYFIKLRKKDPEKFQFEFQHMRDRLVRRVMETKQLDAPAFQQLLVTFPESERAAYEAWFQEHGHRVQVESRRRVLEELERSRIHQARKLRAATSPSLEERLGGRLIPLTERGQSEDETP